MDKTFVKEALFEFLQTIYKFEQKELEEFSISWQEMLLLKNLLIHKECSMGLVTTLLEIKAFQATRLVDGLVKKELVVRFTNQDDKRVKSIAITAQGKARMEKIDDFHHSVIETAAEDLGTQRTKEILETLFHLEQLLGLKENK
ncbi:MAG TPA: winged helix-turn-helix transcriptional regulator [Epulopiscium sp.]|nr:winged helix-turn-helix transcriptional regulator [Candidatus Epulonipiscium sp.]